MPDAKKLVAYWIRHGETSGNAAGTFRGPLDLPLNKHGLADAQTLGEYFKAKPLAALLSSPKKRAQDTARAIADVHDGSLKIHTVPEFAPLNVGYLAGELKSEHDGTMSYFDKNTHLPIPMGESIDDFRRRTQPKISQVMNFAIKQKNPVAAAVHSSIIHEVNHMITGDHNQTLVKPGGILGVYWHPTEGYSLEALFRPTKGKGDAAYHA